MKDQQAPKVRFLHAAAIAVLGVFVVGCSVAPGKEDGSQVIVKEKITAGTASQERAFMIRSGASLQHSLNLLGALDGKMYILDGDDIYLPGGSLPIKSKTDFLKYLAAYGYTVTVEDPQDSGGYSRIHVDKSTPHSKVKASRPDCQVKLTGTIPFGPVVSEICDAAGLVCRYADSGAAAYAGALYSAAYSGHCAGALDYLAHRADLSLSFQASGAEFRMMNTATIDLGIPLRDRRIALDILADGKAPSIGSQTSTNSTGGSGGGATSYSAANSSSGSKAMSSGYATNYFQSVRSILESSKTPWGTWHYIQETGQVFIRDKADAVAAVRESLSRVAQVFQGRFDITLTLYRLTENKGREIGSNLSYAINSNLSLALGNPAFLLGRAAGMLSYNDPQKGTSVVNLLAEWGNVETLDTYNLTVQSGIPHTLKVANNTEYVRNITTSVTGTSGTVSASIEQSNATDGSFVTVQARQASTGKIAVDLGVFVNRVDGFDETTTQTSIVKSQRGFERTFDTLAMVDEGIPYVASVVSQKSNTGKTASLPGLEGTAIGALAGGSLSQSNSKSYIVMIVEARRN